MVLENFRLDGQVVLVSGASRGIGAAIAVACAEAGADVAVGARNEDDLNRVAEQIRGHGAAGAVYAGSLHTSEGMEEFVTTALDQLGPITTVVNNVGGSMPAPFLNTSDADLERAFSWNVTTAFNLSRAAVPHMLANAGGSIVNIASAAGRQASRGFVAYGTAKAAMIQLTRTMAADLAPRIRVNAVAPGAILTDALASVLDDNLTAAMEAGTPMRRIGSVDDIAAGRRVSRLAGCFLCDRPDPARGRRHPGVQPRPRHPRPLT